MARTKHRYVYYYLITNLIDGRQYVGSRFKNGVPPADDGYMGSSVPLCDDIKKFGIENFTKVILKVERFVDKVKRDLHEAKYIHQYNTLRPNGYNGYDTARSPGFNNSGVKMSGEQRREMCEIQKVVQNRPKVRAKMCKIQKEVQNRPEVRAKRSASHKKRLEDPAERARLKKAMNRPEVKAKRIASLKKAMNRPEVKAKMSVSLKKVWKDPEYRAKLSASMKIAQNRPEVKAKRSANMKQYHATHQYRKPAWLIHLEEYRKTLADTAQPAHTD